MVGPADPLASLFPPSQLGRYQVLERLGAGGMAEVLVCIRHGAAGFARAVAVKRILPFAAGDAGFRAMLRREAAIAASTDHPSCVRVDELEEHEGELLLSMELLYGLDASALLARRKDRGEALPPAVALRIGVDALRGLHHVHGLADGEGRPLGVVHRDISPHNVFVTESGLSKVLDFGIATAMEAMDRDTLTGALKGKFRYMAPEQVLLRPLDARTDLWAVAASLYELIAGEPALRGSMIEVLDALRDGPPPIDWSPAITPDVRRLLERALAADPADRVATAEAFADEIEAGHEVASHRVVAQLLDEVAAEDMAALRRRVAVALRTEERLSDSSELAPTSSEEASAEAPPVRALGTTAPGKGLATPAVSPAEERPTAPGRKVAARDTVADDTLAPAALRDARDTLRDEERSPLAEPPVPPVRTRSATPSVRPKAHADPAAGGTRWLAIALVFVLGAALGWLAGGLWF
ncbi:MAG: protein kinase [Sandaracinaceae bacterium]